MERGSSRCSEDADERLTFAPLAAKTFVFVGEVFVSEGKLEPRRLPRIDTRPDSNQLVRQLESYDNKL
jgi:hypothetical protein